MRYSGDTSTLFYSHTNICEHELCITTDPFQCHTNINILVWRSALDLKIVKVVQFTSKLVCTTLRLVQMYARLLNSRARHSNFCGRLSKSCVRHFETSAHNFSTQFDGFYTNWNRADDFQTGAYHIKRIYLY